MSHPNCFFVSFFHFSFFFSFSQNRSLLLEDSSVLHAQEPDVLVDLNFLSLT